MDRERIMTAMLTYLAPLKNYEFTFFNPMFWLVLVCIFLLYLKFWQLKKSFSFSLFLAFMLLSTTEIQARVTSLLAPAGEPFDTTIIKFISLIIVSFFYLIYVFVI